MTASSRSGAALAGQDEQGEQLRERYGLSGNPFAEAPERFFSGGQRQHSLETLKHLCHFGELFLAVTGEAGAGRSRLLAELCRTGKDKLEFRLIPASACVSVEQLARTLWHFLRKPVPPSASPEEAVRAFFANDALVSASRSGRRWVLLLDDADSVPLEVVIALAEGFCQGERAQTAVPLIVASTALFGQLEAHFGERAGVLHPLHLKPLDEDETALFVARCIEWVGGDPSGLLDPPRLKQLQQASGGNLAAIKRLAPGIILGAGAPPRIALQPRRLKRHHALGMVLALLLLGLSYAVISWRYEESPAPPAAKANPSSENELARMRRAMEAAEARSGLKLQPDLETVPHVPPADSGADTAGDSGADDPAAGDPAAGDPAAADLTSEPSATLSPPQDSLPREPVAAPPFTDIVALSVSEILAEELEGIPAGPAPLILSPSPLQVLYAQSEPGPPLVIDLPEARSMESAEPVVSAQAPAEEEDATEPAGFVPELPDRFRDRAWVEGLNPEHYTVQLLGSYHESTAVRFIREHDGTDLFYVRSSYKGEPWFVVLHGTFGAREAAREAVAALPGELRRSGTWIRGVSGL